MYLRINFKQKEPKNDNSDLFELFPFPIDVPNEDEWEYFIEEGDCTLKEFIEIITK